MAVSRDIVESYRAPRRVLARQLAAGVGEERALAYVMIACILFYVALLPSLARAAFENPQNGDFTNLAANAFIGAVLIAPLLFYGLAALGHLAALLLGGRGSWFSARLALFWALLAISPLMLLRGLVLGFIGQGTELTAVNILVGVLFLLIWVNGMRAAEFASD
ncbi:MAG: YIP1 family protein, partial [Halocynthiibacter sp.]